LASTPAHTPLAKKVNRPNYCNGYIQKPQATSYTVYTLPKSGRSMQRAFASPSQTGITPLASRQPLQPAAWDKLAKEAGLIPADRSLRKFQVESANYVISRRWDVCIIAPTGQGKSLVWVLPLLVQRKGVSLVVVPYTSLGHQGALRRLGDIHGVKSHFLHAKNKDPALLEQIATEGGMQIIYLCAEMLEAPTMARVLHAESFKLNLSVIYIDEAHTAYESRTWRPAYTNLHKLRRISGLQDVPMIVLSATLPQIYRHSLSLLVGLKQTHQLIHRGNLRHELSVIVKHMQHNVSSFKDLMFLFQGDFDPRAPASMPATIIYTDNIPRLTEMFYWCRAQLRQLNLPESWCDLIHANLSPLHQAHSTEKFKNGQTRLWLGTEKIGAGIDFPHVKLVVQYCCRDLTLVQWEQRRGRCGRDGSQGLGILLIEKSMADGQLTSTSLHYEDPALLEYTRTQTCYEVASNKLLDNPLVVPPCGTHCSNCSPALLSRAAAYHWIQVMPR
ncbi:P-loop containing nucleoside triphosphate hydrolase protein, partial [Coprinellus micaceus]